MAAPISSPPETQRAPARPQASWSEEPAGGEEREGLFAGLKRKAVRLAPRPIVRALAKPYIAGETRDEAMATVDRLWKGKGLRSTVDILGEAITDRDQAREMLAEYEGVLDALGRCEHANISIKLSALGQGLDDDLCARHLERLLERAASYGQFVRFDMEDATTVDSTLSFYERFAARFPGIGIVLQSRLFRTKEDIRRLAPLAPNVRLCIGIYNEPASIAMQHKRDMKARLLELLGTLWEQGQYVAIATHDEAVIRRALDMAGASGVGPGRYEVQMLLGVPRDALQAELLRRGVKVRLYVPFGKRWYQYCLRRIEHNPEMASLVLKNLFRLGS